MDIKAVIEEVTLNKAQSTKIMANILEHWKQLSKSWSYAAPEVIEADTNNFLWNLYIKGRIDEKDDILNAVAPIKE